ncbi:ABC transporter permease [Saccharopolyspora mangrovi]|uniref:ABC transporter permease n=1 Tax=Saccharopolyspora mangrovi TaxID=3082379 RepID=A0ABU6A3M4_9PSEU|nr:ABC transporter permease [Saccharopolyspora sp. S2-29]MEB3366147.1 ABC transporter permease [Saccharopolyspora sp. S2-29]
MVLALARAELKLLLRNKTVAVSSLLMPILVGLWSGHTLPDDAPPQAWAITLSIQLLMVLGFTVYFAATAALAARREDRYLKRLRSGEASDVVILAGLLTPVVLLGVLQAVLMLIISMSAGAPAPRPLPNLAALVLGIGLCLAAGVATSGRTSSSEQAQITTLPLFLGLMGGVLVAIVGPMWLLLPGGGVGGLLHHALTGDGDALTSSASLLVWIALFALLAKAWFRWEPR